MLVGERTVADCAYAFPLINWAEFCHRHCGPKANCRPTPRVHCAPSQRPPSYSPQSSTLLNSLASFFFVCSQTSHLNWEDKGKGKARAMDSDDTYRLDLGLAPRERGHFADTPQEATTTSRRANPRVRSLDEASLAGLSGVPLPRPPLKFYLTTSNQSLWFWIPRKRILIAPFLSHSSSTSEILHTLQTNFIFLT